MKGVAGHGTCRCRKHRQPLLVEERVMSRAAAATADVERLDVRRARVKPDHLHLTPVRAWYPICSTTSPSALPTSWHADVLSRYVPCHVHFTMNSTKFRRFLRYRIKTCERHTIFDGRAFEQHEILTTWWTGYTGIEAVDALDGGCSCKTWNLALEQW